MSDLANGTQRRPKVLLGLTGTVSTRLAKKIVEEYINSGFEVGIVMTESAKNFITREDLIGTGHIGIFTDKDEWPMDDKGNNIIWNKGDPIAHIDLREMYSAYVIICSANTLAKISNGICDNLVTSLARAWLPYKPFLIAPAMNTAMWEHPLTNTHLDLFKSFSKNNRVIDPQSKMLACGTFGMGALAEISEIVNRTRVALLWKFPLSKCYGIPVNPHPGSFGYERKGSRHTGIDLYTDLDSSVYAVEDGIIVGSEHFTGEWDNSPWWNNTDCILIKGASGVICYGEIEVVPHMYPGTLINKGELLGKVMRVIKEGRDHYEITGWRPTMLHLELYNYNVLKASHGFECDILNDPTRYIIESNYKPNLNNLEVSYDKYDPNK